MLLTRHLQSTTARRLCPAFFDQIIYRRRPPGASHGAPSARIKLICIKLIPKTRGQPYSRKDFLVSAWVLPSGRLFAVRTPGVGGPRRGGISLRSAPPTPGPPAPSSAPPWGLRAGLLRYAARSALPAFRRVRRPLLRAPPAPLGPPGSGGPNGAPSGYRARGPPVGPSLGPLRWSSGAGSAPPLRPSWSGGHWRPPGAAGPPLGGLPWWSPWPWCRASSPPGVGRGALAPPPGGLSLVAPAPIPRRRRAAAPRRQTPRR